jgi:hypothetical protein
MKLTCCFLFSLLVCLCVNAQSSNRKAFLFGVDHYGFDNKGKPKLTDGFELPDLGGCINDVKLLSEVLVSKRNFQPDNITTAIDVDRKGALDAFDKYVSGLKKGDIAFVHFSAMSLPHNQSEAGVACTDFNRSYYEKGVSGYIEQAEMESFFKKIMSRVGNRGQVVLSLDVCYSGNYSNKKETRNNQEENASNRGETNALLLTLSKYSDVPLFIFSSSGESELSMETQKEGKTYGLYSFALANAFADSSLKNARDIFSVVSRYVRTETNGRKQTPGLFSNDLHIPLFENNNSKSLAAKNNLPDLSISGNVFLVSVGISEYNKGKANLLFDNCIADALSYSEFIKNSYSELNSGGKVNNSLLLNEKATRENILKAVNEAISNSKPEDYFIFNFAGYCKPLLDSSGKQVTYFVPHGLKNILDSNEVRRAGIPLNKLKDLLQMIPANNQLFITEAGSTESFQKEFIQALIETNPTIASLTNKNRVFIIPQNSGLDYFYCNAKKVNHGPLNYYLTNLPSDLNIFGVFQGGIYADAIKYALTKNEVECDYFKTSYFDIFFEKDYLKDLEIFLPEGIALYRGGEMEEEIKKEQQDLNVKKYALVIGTDTYTANGWGSLPNALLDARRIAEELRKGFDYNVTLLENKPADSIYDAIRQLSAKLNANDQLIVYVSGHGDFDDKLMDDGFMVCSDSKAKKLDPYRNSYIAYSKLSRMINRLPAKQVLMVLDVCFGGSFDERAVRNKARGDVYDDVATATYYGEKMKLKTRLYLSSGGKVAVPDGYAGKHSPFAHRLLQALQEKGGAQKMLTSSNLFEFVKKLPSGPVLGSFGDDDINTEFILVAK